MAEPDEMEKLLLDIHKTIRENKQFLENLADDGDDGEVQAVQHSNGIEKAVADGEDFEEL